MDEQWLVLMKVWPLVQMKDEMKGGRWERMLDGELLAQSRVLQTAQMSDLRRDEKSVNL